MPTRRRMHVRDKDGYTYCFAMGDNYDLVGVYGLVQLSHCMPVHGSFKKKGHLFQYMIFHRDGEDAAARELAHFISHAVKPEDLFNVAAYPTHLVKEFMDSLRDKHLPPYTLNLILASGRRAIVANFSKNPFCSFLENYGNDDWAEEAMYAVIREREPKLSELDAMMKAVEITKEATKVDTYPQVLLDSRKGKFFVKKDVTSEWEEE